MEPRILLTFCVFVVLVVTVWSYLTELVLLIFIYLGIRFILCARMIPQQYGIPGILAIMDNWLIDHVKALSDALLVFTGYFSAVDSTSRRMIIIGKTGTGKSSTGNTILGEHAFHEDNSFSSVTQESTSKAKERFGRNLLVVDTPGLFDTRRTFVEIGKKLFASLSEAEQGPHVFLFMVKVGAFSEEDYKTFEHCKLILGNLVFQKGILIFTHGDTIEGETLQDYLNHSRERNMYLNEVLAKFEDRTCLFNNKDRYENQVEYLLAKIDKISNSGKSYLPPSKFKLSLETLNEVEKSCIPGYMQKETFIKRMAEKNRPSKLEWIMWTVGAGATTAVIWYNPTKASIIATSSAATALALKVRDYFKRE